MSRCRTCSRTVDHLVLQGDRLLWICARCADRTTVACARCHYPLGDASHGGDRYIATCQRCVDRVAVGLDGAPIERRKHEKAKRTEFQDRPYVPRREGVHVEWSKTGRSRGYRHLPNAISVVRAPREVPADGEVWRTILASPIAIGLGALAYWIGSQAGEVGALFLGLLFLLLGGVIALAIGEGGAQRAAYRATKSERADRQQTIRIDEEEMTVEPRADESWTGTVELDRIRRVRVRTAAAGTRRVRVELDDGTERTVMDALGDDEEVDAVVEQLEKALAVRRARAGG